MSEEKPELDSAPKPGGKNKLIIILVAVNLLAVAGVGAYVVFGQNATAAAAAPAEAAPPAPRFGPLVELRPIVANLEDPLSSRYIKLEVHLQVKDDAAVEPVTNAMVPIRDRLIVYLSAVTAESTVGADNKLRMQEEMKTALNEMLGSELVTQVYFSEFVIQ